MDAFCLFSMETDMMLEQSDTDGIDLNLWEGETDMHAHINYDAQEAVIF